MNSALFLVTLHEVLWTDAPVALNAVTKIAAVAVSTIDSSLDFILPLVIVRLTAANKFGRDPAVASLERDLCPIDAVPVGRQIPGFDICSDL
jgi:hypothetical protein